MTHDRTTFGAGPGSHCAHSAGAGGGVEFLNPTGTYSRGQPIAIACQTWTTRKCSRSVTFMGRTFTANRGYPPCTGDTTSLTGDEYTGDTPAQQSAPTEFTPIARTPSNGIFRVRVWGKVCDAGPPNLRRCWNLKNPTPPPAFAVLANEAGYGATFQTASHCGPASWPTPELQAAGAPARRRAGLRQMVRLYGQCAALTAGRSATQEGGLRAALFPCKHDFKPNHYQIPIPEPASTTQPKTDGRPSGSRGPVTCPCHTGQRGQYRKPERRPINRQGIP